MRLDTTDVPDPAQVAGVLELATHAQPRCGQTRVIAIDGRSGSGKTTLADAISFHLRAPIVHMDELYPGWDGLSAAVGLLTTQVLEPLARGDRAAYPVWDWTHGRWGQVKEIDPAPIVVVEGCGASVHPAGRYAAVRVWLEAPRAQRLARGLKRDGETYRPHWERWAAQEDALFAADGTRAHADLVLHTAPV